MKGPICLIRDCEPYTQKMVKHLSTCHPDFAENQINWAKTYMTIFERNFDTNNHNDKGTDTNFFETSHSLTDDPNLPRKFSYQLCTLCNELFKNMSVHINNVQKVTKKDPNYFTYVNAPVVPGFITKTMNNKTVLLNKDEL